MSITLRKENPIDYATGLVDILVANAGESHANLVRLQERVSDHPDIPVYEKFTADYFSLAVAAQAIANRLLSIDDRSVKVSSLSRVPPDMRVRLGEMAKRHGILIDERVLVSVPYIPLTKNQ